MKSGAKNPLLGNPLFSQSYEKWSKNPLLEKMEQKQHLFTQVRKIILFVIWRNISKGGFGATFLKVDLVQHF